MKSPLTGKRMKIYFEPIIFRDIRCKRKYYLCEDTGERFTDTKLDEENLSRYNYFHEIIEQIIRT